MVLAVLYLPSLVAFAWLPASLAGLTSIEVQATAEGARLAGGIRSKRPVEAFRWIDVKEGTLRMESHGGSLSVDLGAGSSLTWPLAKGKPLRELVGRLPDWCPAIKVEDAPR